MCYNSDIFIYVPLRNLAQHALPLVVAKSTSKGKIPRGVVIRLQRRLSKMRINLTLEPKRWRLFSALAFVSQ